MYVTIQCRVRNKKGSVTLTWVEGAYLWLSVRSRFFSIKSVRVGVKHGTDPGPRLRGCKLGFESLEVGTKGVRIQHRIVGHLHEARCKTVHRPLLIVGMAGRLRYRLLSGQ